MSNYTTVRITTETRDLLRELAEASGQSMSSVLQEAIERLKRERFLREVAASYTALRDDPAAAAALDAEYHAWESTLADGLPKEETSESEPLDPEGEPETEDDIRYGS